MNITSDYDEESDVLYISIGKPQPSICTEPQEGILLGWSEKDMHLCGITILNYSRQNIPVDNNPMKTLNFQIGSNPIDGYELIEVIKVQLVYNKSSVIATLVECGISESDENDYMAICNLFDMCKYLLDEPSDTKYGNTLGKQVKYLHDKFKKIPIITAGRINV